MVLGSKPKLELKAEPKKYDIDLIPPEGKIVHVGLLLSICYRKNLWNSGGT